VVNRQPYFSFLCWSLSLSSFSSGTQCTAFGHWMIRKTILLLFVLFINGCHPFLSSVSSFRYSYSNSLFDALTSKAPELKSRSRSSLFETWRMEIWWDRRNETLEPPKIGSDADRWIVTGDDDVSKKSVDSIVEIFQADGNQLRTPDEKTVAGAIVRLKDSAGQEQALAVLGSVEWLLVEVESYESSWLMIPAENIIAAAQSTGTKLAFAVKKAADVAGLAKALELGVDALCISTKHGDDDPDLWKTAFEARKERNAEAEKASASLSSDSKQSKPKPEIVVGSCWRRDTKGTVLADRICVDLVQKLRPEEGCWVGSSAKIMALVLSEAASSQFVPTRPFRVNAGPVHSYILLGDGITTKYLCELQASDQVTVYNTQTNSSKPVAVGRLKEEIRPCVLVELETQQDDEFGDSVGPRGQVFLQQAETVRLAQPAGEFVRVTDLEAQSGGNGLDLIRKPILLRIMKTGTHVGKVYTGKVEER
jgi:3-dehydroquinate synthase II